MRNAIRTRHEAGDLNRFQCGGPWVDRVGSDVSQDVRVQGNETAIVVEGQRCLDLFSESLGAGS